jgi:hypothetical protein
MGTAGTVRVAADTARSILRMKSLLKVSRSLADPGDEERFKAIRMSPV